ncbi:SufD family Fe-S cluster assembly protein [Candidatus Woesearchaeota archaeon]|nr:SufD family Fe-S cluster assembly protein [Candidatus Woesearchaeota archaeon]
MGIVDVEDVIAMLNNFKLDSSFSKDLEMSGFSIDGELRTGSYMLQDGNLIGSESTQDGLEILDIKEAMKKYSWVPELMNSLVSKDKDEYTKRTAENFDGGYFVWVKEGAKIDLPMQSCLMICKPNYEQRVHNIIVLEKDSELRIITGCLQHTNSSVTHIGISEIFVRENAKLNFTMVHNWGTESLVRPRTAVKIDENGEFVSNYVLLNPVKDIQMNPVAKCARGAKASFNGIIYATENSKIDSGARIELNGENSSGEIISRVVSTKGSKVYSRGQLIGNTKSKAHMECNAIILEKNSSVIAVPEIEANDNEAEMSHEAAVGKIADKEIFYLMTRGLSEDEAVSTIIRGFMDVAIFGLPKNLEKLIQNVVDDASKGF